MTVPDRIPEPHAAPDRWKVLFLSLEYGPDVSGGVGTHAHEAAVGLARSGHEVEVVAYAPEAHDVVRRERLAVHRVLPGLAVHDRSTRTSMVEGILAFNRDLVEYAQALIERAERPPDLIQHFNWMTFPAARELGEAFGLPVLGRFSFLSEPTERYWGQEPDPEMAAQERRVFREGRHFMAVSHSLAGIIAATHGVDETAVPVVHNGVNLERFRRYELAPGGLERLRRTITPDGESLVVFVGRLHPQKGVRALLESAARVLDELPGVRYLLVGEPDSRDYRRVLDAVLDAYPALRRWTTFLGRLPRAQVARLLQAADLVAMPSVYEPFSWVGVEAMAAGAPLVATDSGGTPELVVDGETGFLVSTAVDPVSGLHQVDVGELADRQVRLLRDPALGRRMGRNGRRRVEERFSCERMLESITAVHRRILGAEASAHS